MIYNDALKGASKKKELGIKNNLQKFFGLSSISLAISQPLSVFSYGTDFFTIVIWDRVAERLR